uniref:Uncharacterized protein n=1 Tax=Solanum lycopersicum TaxID=4081 RepID=A0A3Q7HHK5_SOLLC
MAFCYKRFLGSMMHCLNNFFMFFCGSSPFIFISLDDFDTFCFSGNTWATTFKLRTCKTYDIKGKIAWGDLAGIKRSLTEASSSFKLILFTSSSLDESSAPTRIATFSNLSKKQHEQDHVILEGSIDVLDAIESIHLPTTFRSSDHGRRDLVVCRTIIESFQLRKTLELRNTSILKIRFPRSTSSAISRYSAAQRAATTLYGLRNSLHLLLKQAFAACCSWTTEETGKPNQYKLVSPSQGTRISININS